MARVGLRPANESARRIADYHTAKRLDPHLPKSPWNARHQCFYLPATLPSIAPELRVRGPFDQDGFELPPPVAEAEATPDMPRYRPRERSVPPVRGQKGDRVRLIRQVGRQKLEPGATFAHLAWPGPDFEPVNSAAKTVAAYYEAHRDHPALLTSPWCMFRHALFLPGLPQIERRADGTTLEPAPPSRPMFSNSLGARKAYPDGSYRPLDPVTYADAIASEVEAVTGKRPGQPGSAPVSYGAGASTRANRARPISREQRVDARYQPSEQE